VPDERASDREVRSIKGIGCKSGGCASKADELTSGDLPLVPETRLRDERSALTGRQKSAEGEVVANAAGSAHGPWQLANSPALAFALPNAYFATLGLPRLTGR
jgi:hypothetical protein